MIETSFNTYRPCACLEVKRMKLIMDKSGIKEQWINFENYQVKNNQQKLAKAKAMKYSMTFNTVRNERRNSIAFLGQVGAGKTHLSIAIALSLLKQGIATLYMPYREAITHLKQLINHEEEYQREIDQYKNIPVLLIDDLFKGKITEADINAIFEIVNHRYLKHLPIIISSEYGLNRLLDIDEAVGSRIIEMSKDYIVEFTGKENNFRLN